MKKNNQLKNEMEQVVKVPKTNEEMMKEFKRIIRNVFDYGALEYSPTTHYNIRLNGITTWGYYFGFRKEEICKYASEYVEYLITDFDEVFGFEITNKDDQEICKNILKSRQQEIINIEITTYELYIAEKIFEYLKNIDIQKELTESKEEILQNIKSVRFAKFLNNNYAEIVKVIDDEIKRNPIKLVGDFKEVTIALEEKYAKFGNQTINFILNILPIFIEIQEFDFENDIEYCIDILDILEKILKDVKVGKIKDIKTFDLNTYM